MERFLIHWKCPNGTEGQTKRPLSRETAELALGVLSEANPGFVYTLVPLEATADPSETPFFLLNPDKVNR